jgi:hypothetical protein
LGWDDEQLKLDRGEGLILLVKNKKELRACLQNNIPCVKLIGSIETLPSEFSCGLGLKCGRKECTEYEPDHEFWIEEIQSSFK